MNLFHTVSCLFFRISGGYDGDEGRQDDADGFGYRSLAHCAALSEPCMFNSESIFLCRRYGEDAEDEENLDDNEAGIDAPAVSGCAGFSNSRVCICDLSSLHICCQAKKFPWSILMASPREGHAIHFSNPIQNTNDHSC